jgi:putative ABC transport system permease protein
VLFVSGSAFGSTIKRLSERYIEDFEDYDVIFSTQDMYVSDTLPLYEKVKTTNGVYDSAYQVIFSYSCSVETSSLSNRYREIVGNYDPDKTVNLPMKIQFIDDKEYLNFIHKLGLSDKDYFGNNAKMIAVAKKPVNAKGEPGEWIGIFANRSMRFNTVPVSKQGQQLSGGQPIEITFVDTYPVDPPPSNSSEPEPYVFMVVAPYSLKDTFETPGIGTNVGMSFRSKNPAQSVTEIEAMIQSAGITAKYTLFNVYTIVEQWRSLTFVIDVFTYFFVIMISLIAVANVFNTISTNIKLRRRELAMLRSVGMSDREFNRMMNFECVFYGLRTLLFGVPIAGIISWLIYEVMVSFERMENFNYIFPWGSMIISVICVLFIVFITMRYAISEVKKENIIDALRDDMA